MAQKAKKKNQKKNISKKSKKTDYLKKNKSSSFQTRPTKRLVYFICMANRSGSTWLCQMLNSTQLVGRVWELEDKIHPKSEWIQNLATHPYGIKLNVITMERVWPLIDHQQETVKFIWLLRKDLWRQAISQYRAKESQVWGLLTSETLPETYQQISFDRQKITSFRTNFMEQNHNWELWFQKHQITPLKIYYEDLCLRPKSILKRILKHLNRKKTDYPLDLNSYQVLRDQLTDNWLNQLIIPNLALERPVASQQIQNKSIKRVLLLPDVPNWAFDHIAQQIKTYTQQYYPDQFEIIINYYPEFLATYESSSNRTSDTVSSEGTGKSNFSPASESLIDLSTINLVLCFWYGHTAKIFKLFPVQTIKVICIYDYCYWTKKNSICRKHFQKAISVADHILYSCPAIYNRLITFLNDKEILKLKSCLDGVDLTHFSSLPPRIELTEPTTPLKIGWAGKAKKNNDLKGISLIQKVVTKNNTWLEFKCQNAQVDPLSWDQMSDFYQEIDLYICMSSSEGTPNTILEAAASGRPFISTNVGIVPLLLEGGQRLGLEPPPGIVIERTSQDLERVLWDLYQQKTVLVRMGENARIIIEQDKWDWSYRSLQYLDVLNSIK